MIQGLWTGATGMSACQMLIDNTANNLANVNTLGYKKTRLNFQDLFYHTYLAPSMPTDSVNVRPVGIQVGYGVKPGTAEKVFSQGKVTETQNPLDLAIEGDGFFQVLMPDGQVYYTRDGEFKISSEGLLVTKDGYPLEPPITIPENAVYIKITEDGVVFVRLAGETALTQVGQIELARFINPAGLEAVGKNLFKATPASGDPITGVPGENGLGEIHQGFLELSNVDVVEEMVNLITAQRSYEMNSRSVLASDAVLRILYTLVR